MNTDDPQGAGFEGERISYEVGELTERDVDPDPLVTLRRWLDDADRAGIVEPTAMAVASLDDSGRITSRMVLLRRLTGRGPVFFTNYLSDKGRALDAYPRCSALLWWGPLQRQVRIEGIAERIPESESDAYFATRPRDSRVGAWASPQSRPIAGRGELEAMVAEATARFADVEDVPRPPHWGGYEIVADRIEFWQGRPSRLHDRLRFDRDAGGWRMIRLAP